MPVRQPSMAEILGLLAFIALMVYLAPGLNPPPKASYPPAKSLSVYGVRLGMTRGQVEKILGKPLEEKADEVYPVFSEAKYRETSTFGEPEITYSAQGLALAVSGSSLEWPGGALRPKILARELALHFPGGIQLLPPASHPWNPGQRYYPDCRLLLFTEVSGMFSSETFLRAELSVPYLYPARTYWEHKSTEHDALTRLARSSNQTNRQWVQQSQAVGCFYCVKIVKEPQFPYGDSAPGVCPECHLESLLAGPTSQLTPDELLKAHRMFFEP